MIKENLFKKVLATSLCLAMMTSMVACGTKKTANPEPVTVAESTTASSDNKADVGSDYVNAPVANKDLVDDDIKAWKAIDVTPCISTNVDLSQFSQTQIDADASEINSIVSTVSEITFGENPYDVDNTDLCTQKLNAWAKEDGTINQVVYNQILQTTFISPTYAAVTTGIIFNTGTDSFINTNETCMIYEVKKMNGTWKVSNISRWSDKYHDKRSLTDITLQMVRTYEDGYQNTLTDKRVNLLKIVPRS